MLKLVFLDANPYTIDRVFLNKKVWQNTMKWESFVDWFKDAEDLKYFLSKEKNPYTYKKEYLKHMSEKEYDVFLETFEYNCRVEIQDYVKENLQLRIGDFISAALESEAKVILLNRSKHLTDIEKLLGFDQTITTLNVNYTDDKCFETLTEYCSNLNIMCNEYIYVSQNEESLIDMLRNNVFCVTLKNEKTIKKYDNLYIIDSIEDLNFGEISYKFYSKENDSNL